MAVVATTTYRYVTQTGVARYVQGEQLTDRGAWSALNFYDPSDVVQVGINQYIALQPNSNSAPSAIVDSNWSALVVVHEETVVPSAGSDYYARTLASSALSTAQSAYSIAVTGTNAAASALSTAQSAFSIAVIGTGAAASALATAQAAFSLAVDGTITADSALNTAQAAFSIAVDGTNAAASALSVAQAAYALAIIGTNSSGSINSPVEYIADPNAELLVPAFPDRSCIAYNAAGTLGMFGWNRTFQDWR